MEGLKVLHSIQSLSWGGLELYTTELVLKLAEAGVDQVVWCSEHSRVAEELRKSTVPLITYPEKKLNKLQAARRLRSLCRDLKITHLQTHTRLDMWAGALALIGKKSPRHVYNLYMNALPKQDLVHKWLFSKVDALCSSSEFVLGEARRNFPIAPEKLRLMRYGRKTEEFQPSPAHRERIRQNLHLGDDVVFGTLCRIDAGKGVRELVEALDLMTDAEIARLRLVIVGDPTIAGRDENGELIFEQQSLELENWIKQKQQEPRYQGRLLRVPFQKDYVPYIDALDVFILASYNETYSLSVLDAMLMEKPVIGTDAGGTTEQVGKNERGYLVRPKDPASVAEAYRHYIENPGHIREQGTKARTWTLQQHSWPETLKNTLALYQELK